ncbi:L-serine dehydratase, alpha chain [bioreactor metagenome]|uniref:L-serine dehydratase, alpha chain n=1 Tax=bioreactor metagenome TaxID=1076179 RepID=A0A645JCZ1_9ZZZZ
MASLFSDDQRKIIHAMAICLKNLLGLVCDPIAGPIEIPCIKRNAVGVANAFISADMALAGIESFIPPDEVIDALVDVERRLPQELKCATVGGLACTCTAQKVRKELAK